MTHRKLSFSKELGLGLLASSALLFTACGGGDSTPSRSGTTPTPPPSSTPAPTPTPAPGGDAKVSGPLDPVQDQVVTGVVSNEIASQLPDPLNTTVMCAASAVNHLVDAPDAILAAVADAGSANDPFAAFNAAQGDVQASLERFAAQLQSTLVALVDRGSCDPDAAGSASATNPLAGTPLEPVGAAVLDLVTTLDGTQDDPNLTSVTSALAPVLSQLSAAFNQIPAEVSDAPVVGGVVATLQDAVADLATMLPAVGNYNAAGTTAGIENLLNNVISNVLLNVLPVDEAEDAPGEDISDEIQAGIDTLTAQFGGGLAQLITPVFNQGLNGVLSPVLDPVEGVLASLVGGGDVLSGVLASVAGNGFGTPADAVVKPALGQFNVLPWVRERARQAAAHARARDRAQPQPLRIWLRSGWGNASADQCSTSASSCAKSLSGPKWSRRSDSSMTIRASRSGNTSSIQRVGGT